jgi:spore germination protein
MLRLKKILMVFLIPFLLSGCWDRIEIEERGFVVGAGLELMKEEEKEKYLEEQKLIGDYPIELTYQFVEPRGLGSPTQGAGQAKAFLNLTGSGDSALEVTRDFANNTSRTPYFEHMKMIIISEEAAKEEHIFSNLLDFYLRDNEMRRGAKVLVGKDPKEILNTDPHSDKIPVMYIDSLTENRYKNSSIVPLNRIGDIHEKLLNKQSFTLQFVSTSKKLVRLSGAAVFHGHNNKMVGKLTDRESTGANLIYGEVKGGVIKVKYKGNIVVFEIRRAKSSITGNVENKDNMSFTINIETEGFIEESFSSVDFKDRKEISELQKEIEKEIINIANEAINKSKELNAEVLGLSDYMVKEHYDVWETIKSDWDHGENYFVDSEIKVEAKVNVRSTGTLYKSSEK